MRRLNNANVVKRMTETFGHSNNFATLSLSLSYALTASPPPLIRPIAHFAGCDHVQIPILTRVSRVSNVSEHKSMVKIAQ